MRNRITELTTDKALWIKEKQVYVEKMQQYLTKMDDLAKEIKQFSFANDDKKKGESSKT